MWDDGLQLVLWAPHKDTSMRLNLVQRNDAEHWLKARHIADCLICGLHDFLVGELTVAPVMVQIICGNCGHVLLFDAQTIGLVL